MPEHIYLSRRNLISLLNKLDRRARGELTHCTIIKSDTTHPRYPATRVVAVTAVEDDDYYKDRAPGPIYSEDEPS